MGLLISTVSSAQNSPVPPKYNRYEAYLDSLSAQLAGKRFPDFRIPAASGKQELTNKDLAGKVVFVNFWFTDCPPCMAEMKGLNLLYDSLKKNKDFKFLSITFDPETTLNKTVDKYNIKYPVVRMDKEDTKRLNFRNGYPTSFILDRKGVVIFFRAGGDIDEENATDDILKILYPKIAKELVPVISE